jgi:ubiquinone/menaquinone biosynthesis C-methylase UbiE
MTRRSPCTSAPSSSHSRPPLGSDDTAVGTRILLTSELLCESVDLHAGERVLDVACGSGNAALAAARRFCRVIGVDDAPELLKRARRRAEAEGLKVTFLEGDAGDLPSHCP